MLLFGLPIYVQAQVLVQTGVLTGARATSAGAAGRGIGKALSSAFGNAENALKSASQPQSKTPPNTLIATSAETPVEIVKLPDVTEITTGMPREEVLAKFGNPSQKMTIPEGGHLIERFRYDQDKESVKVILERRPGERSFLDPRARGRDYAPRTTSRKALAAWLRPRRAG